MWMKSRIEQHIIGAYLSGRPLTFREAQLLRPQDLSHPVADTILADVQEIREQRPRAEIGQVAGELTTRLFYKDFGISAAALAGWCQTDVPDSELAAGMRLFLHLGVEREIKELSQAIQHSVNWKDGGHMSRIYQRDLAAAIERRWEKIDFATVTPDWDRRKLLGRYETPAPLRGQEPSRERVLAEEQILAGLMENDGLPWVAAGVIDESMFTNSYRRELYRAIDWADRYSFGETDKIGSVMNWLTQNRACADSSEFNWHGYAQDVDYLRHLSETYAEQPRTEVVKAGRELLTEDLRASLERSEYTTGYLTRRETFTDLMAQPPVQPDQDGPHLRP